MDATGFKVCPECDAESPATASRCWMCRHDISQAPRIVAAEIVTTPPSRVSEAFFMIMTLLLLGTALLIGIGLATEERGLAVVYAIFVVPPLAATVISLQRRKSRQQVTWANRFATLLISATVMAGLVGLLGIAAIAALIAFCFVMMASQ